MSLKLYANLEEIITNEGVAKKQGRYITPEDLGIRKKESLLWCSRRGVLWIGKKNKLTKALLKQFSVGNKSKSSVKEIDGKGKILTPALADSHTHLVYGGNRFHELAQRLQGKTYEEIAKAGGGIASTVNATRNASAGSLQESAQERLNQMEKHGVGLVEIKSGYGLNLKSEMKLLQVISKLKDTSQMVIRRTFMGAHAFPLNAKTEQEKNEYVQHIVEEMIPLVAKKNWADDCDVFFEKGYFDRSQTEKIFESARHAGLGLRLHADEFYDNGGALLAAQYGALSADHLLCANNQGIEAMAKAGTVAVLLPTTALYLKVPYANGRKMVEAGVCIAIATDSNPGSSPTTNLPLAMTLACLGMGLSMEQSLAAATYGGAKAMGFHSVHGHIAPGKRTKLALFNCPSYQYLMGELAHGGLCSELL